MIHVRPLYVPVPFQDSADAGRLILRDGATASVRRAKPSDFDSLYSFFKHLSPEARQRRFFSASPPSRQAVEALCQSDDPRKTFTLLVLRADAGTPHIIATGSYIAKNDKMAEAAFAVDDEFQGKGLGALLLERLALLAVRNGFSRFWAVTQAQNQAMLDVFRESGFPVEEKWDQGYIEVDLGVVPTAISVARAEMHDRVATVASMRPFFHPRAVAVIGASRDPASIGYRLLAAIKDNEFHGPIYPVNPKADVLQGLPCYAAARELPKPVDLAVIAVPAGRVLDVVDDCAAAGIRSLVVISAGFAEIGLPGRELQQKLLAKVRGYGMRMIGPNCMGLVNADPTVRLNASFSTVLPAPGRVSMASQSGALGLGALAAARRFQLGLSMFVSVGNKADVSGNDLLQYWEDDEATSVILLYLESFGNPRRFARIARRVSRRKPIVAIKGGRTKVGQRAAGSHTAALAANQVAVDALFQQTGVIRAETLEEMFDLAGFLGNQPLPLGRRVGIVTNAGGPGILCADMCEAGGLLLPELSQSTRDHLAQFLPPEASLANPVDMIASATCDQFKRTVQTMLACGEMDTLIVIHIPIREGDTEVVAAAIRDGVAGAQDSEATTTPVLACMMTVREAELELAIDGRKIPQYQFPESAARVVSKVAAYAEWRGQPEGLMLDFDDLHLSAARSVCQKAIADRGAGWLTADEVRAVLTAASLPLLPGRVVRTATEAQEVAAQVGFPVALKAASHRVVHKTEIGGVVLVLTDAAAVASAFERIHQRLVEQKLLEGLDGILVQPMVSGGVELMVGVTHDPLFGPLIAFGLGGIHVEILGDVCFRIAPLTDRDAKEMVQSIRGYRLLQGYRGHPPADTEAVEEILLRISRLVEEVPEIGELDLNPVFALPPGEGCRIVDARIAVRQS